MTAEPMTSQPATLASARTTDEVDAFFDSYRAAFERLDAAAIADHFAYPAHVTSDDGDAPGLLAIAERREWATQLEGLLEMYRAIGFQTARIAEQQINEVAPRLIQASVRWELLDGAGDHLYDFHATYTLAQIAGRLLISAIAHDELPRHRECAARLKTTRLESGE